MKTPPRILKQCPQCGQAYTQKACGPTHAVVAARLKEGRSHAKRKGRPAKFLSDRAYAIISRLKERNPEAMLADGLDEAIIGIAMSFGGQEVAAYSYEECIAILKKGGNMSEEEAIEFFEFNVIGSYVGTGTPIFIETGEVEE